MDRRAFLASAVALAAGGGASAADRGQSLVDAARRQIGVTKGYDQGYHRISYPYGDVPMATGVCADVVVRAARSAWGIDLQKVIHDDMAAHFAAYPQRWGLSGPDPNIDHRRVPNLEAYWRRQGAEVRRRPGRALGFNLANDLAPGDILTWRSFPFGGPHVAIVSEAGRWPRVVQNHGWGVHEDYLLTMWLDAAEAHFRWAPAFAGTRPA